MESKTTIYRITYKGMTYDSDYGERINVNMEFDTLEKATEVRDNFVPLCEVLGILDCNEFSSDKRKYVNFEDVERLADEGIFPSKAYVGDLKHYQSGFFYPEENARITEIETTVRTREINR